MAVVMILLAILFPAILAARARAYDADCMSNLKQIGAALYLYASGPGDGFFPKPGNDSYSGDVLIHPLAEYIPAESPVWMCKRYAREKNVPMSGSNSYFYWAWDLETGLDIGAASNRWMGKGLAADLPGMVLASDPFEGTVLGDSKEVQYHGGYSFSVPLSKAGTMVVIAGGSTFKISPTRGIIR